MKNSIQIVGVTREVRGGGRWDAWDGGSLETDIVVISCRLGCVFIVE